MAKLIRFWPLYSMGITNFATTIVKEQHDYYIMN